MTTKIAINITRVSPDIDLPSYANDGDAGMDIRAYLPDGDITIAPGDTALVKTGLKVGIPKGWEIQVRPRSGLAAKHAISVTNAPGTIDSGYRGEIGVILTNHGQTPFAVQNGERIAQIIAKPVPVISWVQVDESDLGLTERGHGGFGSSGKK